MLVEQPPIVSFHAAAPAAEAVHANAHAIHIRIADAADCPAAVGALLHKMYAWRGYATGDGAGQSASRVTLYAESNGVPVGTMSLWLDRHGTLPADELYGDRLDLLRRQGRRLCEPSRLAIDPGMSKRVFAALIHVSYVYAHHLQGFSDYVIEVNPRHVAFYKRMLGFAELGGERDCARVGAPAVLLRLPLEHMGAQIRQWGGRMEQGTGEKSFYPYFFAVRDEASIVGRLAAGGARGSAA
jgi:hypothetical protein